VHRLGRQNEALAAQLQGVRGPATSLGLPAPGAAAAAGAGATLAAAATTPAAALRAAAGAPPPPVSPRTLQRVLRAASRVHEKNKALKVQLSEALGGAPGAASAGGAPR
jgi:hypothetical protein